jgi:hypothetical protein
MTATASRLVMAIAKELRRLADALEAVAIQNDSDSRTEKQGFEKPRRRIDLAGC